MDSDMSPFVAPSLNLMVFQHLFFTFYYIYVFSSCTIVFLATKEPLNRLSLCYSHYHSSHKKQPSSMTLNRSPHTDLNGCVKLQHLRARGWTHWSYTMFSLGPDTEYWYTEYGSTLRDITWNIDWIMDACVWVNIVLCVAFSTLWNLAGYAACWCKYDHDKPNHSQMSMINGPQNWLICLRLPWQTKCFIISINKSV